MPASPAIELNQTDRCTFDRYAPDRYALDRRAFDGYAAGPREN